MMPGVGRSPLTCDACGVLVSPIRDPAEVLATVVAGGLLAGAPLGVSGSCVANNLQLKHGDNLYELVITFSVNRIEDKLKKTDSTVGIHYTVKEIVKIVQIRLCELIYNIRKIKSCSL